MEYLHDLAAGLDNIEGLEILLAGGGGLIIAAAFFFVLCGKKDRLGTLLAAFAFMVFSGIFIFLTNGIEELGGSDSSSKLMPYLWSVPLFFASLFQIIRVWRSDKAKPAGHGRLDKVLYTFAVVAASIYFFTTLGFFVSTAAMIILLMLLYGERRVVLILGTAGMWVLFTWLVFNKVLLLRLPTGTLFAGFFG